MYAQHDPDYAIIRDHSLKIYAAFLPQSLEYTPRDVCVVIDAVRAGASLVAMAEAGEELAGGLVPNLYASTALYWIVAIVFFDWAVQKSGQAMHTAWVIALSQILLVDFNYVMVGRRELTPALVSVGTLLVIWSATAFVYDKLSDAA